MSTKNTYNFKQNKYLLWYNNIIQNALSENRIKGDRYFEKHHIIPKSLGGSDNDDNFVLLTAKEHFIIHHILIKITIGADRRKMLQAFSLFCYNFSSNYNKRNKISPRQYQKLKSELSKLKSIRQSNLANSLTPEERKEKWGQPGETNPMYGTSRCGKDNPFFGKKHTDECKRNMSLRKKQYYKDNCNNTKNSFWVNNGIIEKRVKVIPQGFVKGFIKRICPHCKTLQSSKKYHFNDFCRTKQSM